MAKLIIALLLGLSGGLGVAWWQAAQPPAAEPAASISNTPFDSAEIELLRARVELLERQLQQRPEAASRVDLLEMEELAAAARSSAAQRSQRRRPNAEEFFTRQMERRERDRIEREQQLQDAGFDPVTIARIDEIEAAAKLEQLEKNWEAGRKMFENQDAQLFTRDNVARRQLETELGSETFERYIEATGGRLNISLVEVIPGSPAAAAGLQLGDRLISYDGNRTTNRMSLQVATYQGQRGEPVLLEFERDGQPMSVTVPRGPLGVTGR